MGFGQPGFTNPSGRVGLGSRRSRAVSGAFVWSGFTQELGFATVNTTLSIPPIGVQEMVLGVWLIAKGFRAVPAPAGS